MPIGKLPVCDADLSALRRSGLTDETIWLNKLRTETDARAITHLLGHVGPWAHRAGASVCRGGLVIPYFDHEGRVNCYARVRPHYPRQNGKGKVVKYEAPVGEPPRAYIPPASRR